MTALLLVGLAITFAIVWLRHGQAWAKVVTLILAVAAVASVFLIDYFDILWPIGIILGGIYLFYTALRPKTV
jgi:hypothetical protein